MKLFKTQSIPTYEEMPDDNAELANLDIDFPKVSFNKVSEPEEIEPHLLDYLDREGYKPDDGLQFIRTAQVFEQTYWIWSFVTDGEEAYATATQDEEGDTGLGCDTNDYKLSPEQYILADYHNCI